jgi:hypothetical protein
MEVQTPVRLEGPVDLDRKMGDMKMEFLTVEFIRSDRLQKPSQRVSFGAARLFTANRRIPSVSMGGR